MVFELFWFPFLMLCGWAIGTMAGDSPPLALLLGRSVTLGLMYCIAWSVFWVLFPIGILFLFFLMAVGAVCFLLVAISRGGLPSLPSIGKQDVSMLLAFGVLCLVILTYLQRFPYLPEFPSQDFIIHAINAQNLMLHPMDLGSDILYGGVYSLLSPYLYLSGLPELQGTRYAAAWLISLSPFVVYWALSELGGAPRKALGACMVYIVTGTVWFGMGFDVGLYPNLLGLLVSLALLAAVRRFLVARPSLFNLALLFLACVSVYFSHYSDLFALFPVAALALWKIRTNIVGAALVLSLCVGPVLSGYLVYPGLASGLLSFAASTTGTVPAPTALSRLVPLPVLSYMVAESSYDAGFEVLCALFLVGALLALKRREAAGVSLLLWWAVIIIASPLGPSSWRFAFVALFPFALVAGEGLGSLHLERPRFLRISRSSRLSFRPDSWWHRYRVHHAVVLLLLFAGSWTAYAMPASASQTSDFRSSELSVVSAVGWLTTHGNGTAIALTNWQFSLSEYMGGPGVSYEPSLVSSADAASFTALRQHAKYLIVTNLATLGGFPICASPFILTLGSSNSTKNGTLDFSVRSLPAVNGTLLVYVNGTTSSQEWVMANGSSDASITFSRSGLYRIYVGQGEVSSNSLMLKISKDLSLVSKSSEPLSPYWCWPFNWDSQMLGGAKLVYNDTQTYIWCVVKTGCER